MSPATVTFSLAARRRIVALFLCVAIAVTGLVLPQSIPSARAASPRLTISALASYARTMLGALNNERRAHGKRPLVANWHLQLSAWRHNRHMAYRDEMSHQLRREPFFATRISNAGYRWQAAAENIGWNSDLSLSGVLYLQRAMYHEAAPDNGHRQNILSSSYTQVGINVYYDAAHNKIWFTQDFGQPATW
ncbi:MAG: CAP domain-containing protein [Jatrophihabitantaceae bacterium]